MSKLDPYEILGINQNASETEVKKAYRDLARKCHPDKGGTEEKFKEINEAYTQIIDGSPIDAFPELDDLFKIFRHAVGFGSFMPKGPTIGTKLELTLEQLELGGKYSVNYQRFVPTGRFNSSVINTPFGIINQVSPEEVQKTFKTEITIPKCHDHKKSLTFSNLAKGDSLPPGDLEVVIILIKHPIFTKISGTLDLQTEFEISLKEALVGFDKEIKLLNTEEIVKIECRSIVNPYDIKRIKNYGMQFDENTYGDLLIKFKIVFPVILSSDVLSTIRDLEL